MAKKSNFAALLAPGENPNGFRAENPSGFGHGGIGGDYEQQWNPASGISGPRWNPIAEPAISSMPMNVGKRRRK